MARSKLPKRRLGINKISLAVRKRWQKLREQKAKQASAECDDSVQSQTSSKSKNDEMQEIPGDCYFSQLSPGLPVCDENLLDWGYANQSQQSFTLRENNKDNLHIILSSFPTRSITVLPPDSLTTDNSDVNLQQSLSPSNANNTGVTISVVNRDSLVDSNQSDMGNLAQSASVRGFGDTENGNGKCLLAAPVVATPNSIYNIQSSIILIPGGKSSISSEVHLKIRAKSHQYFLADIEMLKNVLIEEGFITHSIRWLHQKRHLPHELCVKCGLCDFELKEEITVKSGYTWQCQSPRCFALQAVNRPRFFQRFPSIPLEVLLLLTYHWAVMSRLEDILKELPHEVNTIWYYFQVLQELCKCVMKKPSCQLDSLHDQNVEACAVELGRYVVLGAHAKQSGCVRLHALTSEDAYHSAVHTDLLRAWVTDNSNLCTEKSMSMSKALSCEASNENILPIKAYLVEKLTRMFGWVDLEALSYNSLSMHLAELQWREKFGKDPEMAFWNIMSQIACDEAEFDLTVAMPKNMLVKYSYEVCLRWGSPEKVSVIPKRVFAQKRKYNQVEKMVKDPYAQAAGLMYKQRRENLKNVSPSMLPLIQEKSAPLLSGGITEVTGENLLRIKTIFDESDSSFVRKLIKEGILRHPASWLLKNGFVKRCTFCKKCRKKSILVRIIHLKDDYAWFCQKCRRHIDRFPKYPFFAQFRFSMRKVLMVVMQWAHQGMMKTFHSMLKLNAFQVSYVWHSIQEACMVFGQDYLLGGENSIVEVCIFEYGPYFILTAHDRKTKLSRLKAFIINKSLQPQTLIQVVESWVHPMTTIVVNSRIFDGLGKDVFLQQCDPKITNKSDPGFHILNGLEYMVNHLLNIFGEFQFQQFTLKTVEMYLKGFMWRERYGRTSKDAFWNIMSDITSTNLKTPKTPDHSVRHEDVKLKDYPLFDQVVRSFPSFSHPELNRMQTHVGLQAFSPKIVKSYSILPTINRKSVAINPTVVEIKKEPEDSPDSRHLECSGNVTDTLYVKTIGILHPDEAPSLHETNATSEVK